MNMTLRQRNYADGFKEQALAKVFGRSSEQTIASIADGQTSLTLAPLELLD
jgi:hypothetical protein